jgi:drug/metabolite transporter (DMT)-like permease
MKKNKDTIIGQAFGLGAGLAYGLGSVLIRRGITGTTPPLVGAVIALLSGTLTLATLGARDFKTSLIRRKAVVFLLISGVATAGGIISNFFALSLAPVVVVSPLQSISPIFALLLSHLFLGHLERITLRLVIGSFLVVGGVILITIGRTL